MRANVRLRVTALALGLLATGLVAVSCADEPLNAPVQGGGLHLMLQPSAALLGTNDQACAKTTSAHVTMSGSGLAFDTTVAVTSCDGPITLDVPLASPTGAVQIALDESGQGQRLFTASGSATLRRGARSETTMSLVPVVGGLAVADTLPMLTAIGDSVVAAARAIFGTGDTITTPVSAATWTADASGVVRVSAGGAIVALKEGQATVTATLQSFTRTTTIRVKATVNSVTVSPDSVTLLEGGSVALTAVAKDRNGNVLQRTATWQSSNTAVATVSTSGLVQAVAPGQATVTATVEGRSGSARIFVVRPVLTATPTQLSFSGSQGGTSPPSQPVSIANAGSGTISGLSSSISYTGSTTGWLSVSLSSTTAPATLTVTATTGSLVAGTYQAVITLSSTTVGAGTAQVNVTFTVGSAQVARVAVTPSSATLVLPSTIQLTATTYDAAGNVLTGRTISWTSSDPQIAAVTSTGYVLAAGGTGTVVITATSEGKSGTSTITVVPPPRIAASPTSLSFDSYPYPPAAQAVSITNAGGGTLSGIYVSSITYSGPVGTAYPTGWLSVLGLSSSTAPAILTLQPNTYYSGWGNLTATVVVTSSNGGSVSIVVTYVTGIIG